MAVYVLLFLFIAVSGFFCYRGKGLKNRNRLFFICCMVSMGVVTCLRDKSIGADTVNYIKYFEIFARVQNLQEIFGNVLGVEPIYVLLNRVIAFFSTDPQILIAVVGLIILALHLKFMEHNSKDYFLSVILFLGFNFFITSLVSWRQFIAMGVVMWCYPALKGKKYMLTAILGVIAAGFHASSVLFLIPCILVVLFVDNHKKLVVFFAAAVLSVPFITIILDKIIVFFPKYQAFYYSVWGGNIGGMGTTRTILALIETMFIILVLTRKNLQNKENIEFSAFMIFSVYAGVLNSIPWMFRLGYYYEYLVILFVPKLISNNMKYKKIFQTICLCACFVMYCYYLSTNPGMTVPYKFFWEGEF